MDRRDSEIEMEHGDEIGHDKKWDSRWHDDVIELKKYSLVLELLQSMSLLSGGARTPGALNQKSYQKYAWSY